MVEDYTLSEKVSILFDTIVIHTNKEYADYEGLYLKDNQFNYTGKTHLSHNNLDKEFALEPIFLTRFFMIMDYFTRSTIVFTVIRKIYFLYLNEINLDAIAAIKNGAAGKIVFLKIRE